MSYRYIEHSKETVCCVLYSSVYNCKHYVTCIIKTLKRAVCPWQRMCTSTREALGLGLSMLYKPSNAHALCTRTCTEPENSE